MCIARKGREHGDGEEGKLGQQTTHRSIGVGPPTPLLNYTDPAPSHVPSHMSTNLPTTPLPICLPTIQHPPSHIPEYRPADTFWHISPVLETGHSEFEQFVPHTGLRSWKGRRPIHPTRTTLSYCTHPTTYYGGDHS